MPGSVGSFNEVLARHVAKIAPTSILDVGCGAGFHGHLFRAIAPTAQLEAIEPTEKYWTDYNLENTYNILHKMTVQDFTETDTKIYDLVICFDILEHLYLSEAIDTIECLLYSTRNMIIAWPTNYTQGHWEGNPYEKHKSNMTLADLTRFDITYYQKVSLVEDNSIMYHYAHIKSMHGKYCPLV